MRNGDCEVWVVCRKVEEEGEMQKMDGVFTLELPKEGSGNEKWIPAINEVEAPFLLSLITLHQ